MPKSRVETRASKKIGQTLDRRNEYGFDDPTPYQAVRRIAKQEQLTIRNVRQDLTVYREDDVE